MCIENSEEEEIVLPKTEAEIELERQAILQFEQAVDLAVQDGTISPEEAADYRQQYYTG